MTYEAFGKIPPILDPDDDGFTGNPDEHFWADYMNPDSEEAEIVNDMFGSMQFDADGNNVYEFENVAMRIRGEDYTDGYAFKKTPEFNFNDTEMGNWPGKLTFRIYLQPADYKETVKITPADVTIYVGGHGYGGVVVDEDGTLTTDKDNGFPKPGFLLTLPESLQNVDIEKLTLQYEDGANTYAWGFVKYGEGNHNV